MPYAVYKMESRNGFPAPKDEIKGLQNVNMAGQDVWLKLASGQNPPLVGQEARGIAVYICMPNVARDNLFVVATARVHDGGGLLKDKPPPSHLIPLYGDRSANFIQLQDFVLMDGEKTATDLQLMDQNELTVFLRGQPHCKLIVDRAFPGGRRQVAR